MNGKSSRYDKLENMLQDGLCSEPHNLPLKYLRDITNNFSDERLLGEGGFGTVYKGVLQNGETIAVKKLHSSIPGVKGRHFENEANHLMRLKHPNVVLLVGWCFENEKTYTEYNGKYIWAEKPERLLCLEYMPKGNLRAYLSDEFSGLGWDTRYKIIEGICYGLHYLHKEWQLNARIVHMDLKPANILLDNNMVPKIADFGLSRLFSEEKTWTCTISRDGTLGYMSPEYINKGLVSTKSDIFSLGVIIIEIVTGHRDYPDETGTSSEKFIEMVLNNWSQRNRVENLFGHVSLEVEYQQIRKCIQIGLDCVKIDRFKRPTISQIIKTLHGLASADSSNIKGVHRSEAKMRPFEREETTIGGSLTDELLPVFSQSNSVASNGAAEEAVTAAAVGEDLMSQAAGGNAPPSPFFAAGDSLLDELQLQEQLAFLNDDGHHQLPLFTSECRSPGAGPGDTYEATKVVFSRIQELDPDHAAKIMGFLLIQGHGEKEMIRLAFGPDALLHTVMAKARKDLGLLPAPGSGLGTPTSVTSAAAVHSPFLLSRQNSGRCGGGGAGTAPSPLSVSSPSSWAPPPVFSRSNSVVSNGAAADEALAAGVGDDLMSPAAGGNAPPSPFFAAGDPLLDELQLQEQLAFLNDAAGGHQLPLFDAASECRSPGAGDAAGFFPYGGLGWANGGGPGHRRSSSVSELCLGGADGLGWKPCLYYARGYCKNGSACRFVHGGLPDDATALTGAKMDTATLEQQCQDILLRSKSQRLAAAAFPYSPTGSLPGSPSAATKCLSLLLQQQQQNENQRAAAAAAAAALMLGGDDAHKFMGRPRLDRADLASMMNPGSRQIYLTFPADSTFREEDVSNYFSIYGPVHDVRIPYQQKRMFGFVTFVYPETVKLILAKGNPHFICDARVLVKPYKEKGKVPDKYRKQQLQGERVDFSNGLDARDHFDLHQLGARMLQHSHSANEMLLRRKLEEQQQAMELQSRRLMGLQLLDLKPRSSPSPIGTPFSPTRAVASPTVESPPDSAGEQGKGSGGFLLPQRRAVNGGDKEESAGDASPNADSDQSAEHNLPDSPFASPTKKSAAAAYSRGPFAPSDSEIPAAAGRNAAPFAGINNGGLTGHRRPSALDIPSPKPYFFPMSRLSSDHGAGAIGM